MRKSVWTICILALVFCLVLLLLNSHHGQKAVLNGATAESSNQPPYQTERPKVVERAQGGSGLTNAAKVMQPVKESETVDTIERQKLAAWQAPINFYGKVVDDSNIPVAGASIQFNWTETPTEAFEERPGENSTTSSDADGLFALRDKRGPTLDVRVSKPGYYTSRNDTWTFSYSLNGNFSPDPLNPVIFHLRKRQAGEPLIHIAGIGLHTMRDYLLSPNGDPTDVSLFDGKVMPVGQGDLEVTFRAGRPLDNFPNRITWQCTLTVPGGGLTPTSEEFPFLAPEDDYQAADFLSITATNWTDEVSRQYFLKLRNGDFGRVNLRVLGTTRPYFRMESFVNPAASRDLEPQ